MIAHIFADLCNACGDCVPACPTHVLDVCPTGVPEIARPDQCQTCFMCELYCPADAIYVAPDRHEQEQVDPELIRQSGMLGGIRRGYGWHLTDDSHTLDEFWRLGPLLREGAETAAMRHAERHHGTAVEGTSDRPGAADPL